MIAGNEAMAADAGAENEAGTASPHRTEPAYWNGTLLKCVSCRLKFPFSAANHPFVLREPGDRRLSVVEPNTPTTRCPQCDGWVPIAPRQR